MKVARWFSFFVLLCIPVSSDGQTAPPRLSEEAKKEMFRRMTVIADQMVADIPNFRLGYNRALIYSKAGFLICKSDRTRAGELFQSSIGELLNAQTLAESERKPNQTNELLNSQSTRPMVLQQMAICDADLALQTFYRSRPAAVEKALSGPAEKSSKIGSNSENHSYLAQAEITLEQSLISHAASQNPERALALLKESLKRGISGATLSLLQKLNTKDPDEATRQASDVVGKLLQKTFATSGPEAQYASLGTQILAEHIRVKLATEKPIKFDDSQMRILAEKVFVAYTDQKNTYGYIPFDMLLRIAEKLSPGYVVKLKAKQSTTPNRFGSGHSVSADPAVSSLLNGNPSADKLISEARNFPLESRRQIYSTAANKLADADNLAGAHAMLNENFSDDALVNAQESVNYYYAHRLMNQGKYVEAERMMNDFPDSNRHAALINLALVMFDKDKVENKVPATAVLEKVRMQMSEKPANQNELSQLMKLISAYSKVDPPQAFRLVDAIVPQLNDLAEASIMVAIFQGGRNIQQGELPVGQANSFGFNFDATVLKMLAASDFDRTLKVIDGFTRPEMRYSLRSTLSDNPLNLQLVSR